jgi:maltooligosyltrehalose trehalohydrolase
LGNCPSNQRPGKSLGRNFFLVAESDLNDVRVLETKEQGGLAIDGQWADEIHHALHTTLTGEELGYYSDFGRGTLEKALEKFFVYDGNYRAAHGRRYGRSTAGWEPGVLSATSRITIRLGTVPGVSASDSSLLHLSSAWLLPLFFCIPELPCSIWGRSITRRIHFSFFVSHGDVELLKAVSEGRHREFAAFGWDKTPDPAEEKTFLNSKLDWEKTESAGAPGLPSLYQGLDRPETPVDIPT